MPDAKPTLEHAEVRYEKSDAPGGTIIALGVLLAVLCLLAAAATGWLFELFTASEQRKYQPLPALAAKQRIHLPDGLGKIPEPRLQVSEPLDLVKLRALEDPLLHSHGWVDRDKGIVRIPIDEAMRLLVERSSRETKK